MPSVLPWVSSSLFPSKAALLLHRFLSPEKGFQQGWSFKPGACITMWIGGTAILLGCYSCSGIWWKGKEECLGRWHCKRWETCKCQWCYLAFLEQENGPADTSWILAKYVGGHVVNLLVAAVAKKLSSHVGTLAGGRESTCRNKASHSTNSAVCMQKKRYFCKWGLRNKMKSSHFYQRGS